MKRMTIRKARCSCGQLRVACRGEPAIVVLCHCRACQMRTGSPYGVAAFFARGAVVISGTYSDYDRPADSGFRVLHHFCPVCGSTVFWEPSRRPEMIAVAVGAFADPEFPAPQKAVFEQHRHPWVAVQLDR
ncbi:GFA family protein [Bosea sp. RAF48]|uniref:GFA family protein n=1 Tax=Bosea sp. RAF48 TaxID=3237480 RepID=UPI003F92BD45